MVVANYKNKQLYDKTKDLQQRHEIMLKNVAIHHKK
jgi:hypothetical protein